MYKEEDGRGPLSLLSNELKESLVPLSLPPSKGALSLSSNDLNHMRWIDEYISLSLPEYTSLLSPLQKKTTQFEGF